MNTIVTLESIHHRRLQLQGGGGNESLDLRLVW